MALAYRIVVVSSFISFTFLNTPVGAAKDRSDDRALAKRAVLKVADLEPGCRKTKPDDSTEESFEDIKECSALRVARRRARDVPHADAAFARQDAEIENEVGVYRSVTAAKRALASLRRPETSDCFQKAGLRPLSSPPWVAGARRTPFS